MFLPFVRQKKNAKTINYWYLGVHKLRPIHIFYRYNFHNLTYAIFFRTMYGPSRPGIPRTHAFRQTSPFQSLTSRETPALTPYVWHLPEKTKLGLGGYNMMYNMPYFRMSRKNNQFSVNSESRYTPVRYKVPWGIIDIDLVLSGWKWSLLINKETDAMLSMVNHAIWLSSIGVRKLRIVLTVFQSSCKIDNQ